MIPFEITDGKVGSNGKTTVELKGEGRMWRRRGVKWGNDLEDPRVEWLVVEMDGVRVYVMGDKIVVTKENLRP